MEDDKYQGKQTVNPYEVKHFVDCGIQTDWDQNQIIRDIKKKHEKVIKEYEGKMATLEENLVEITDFYEAELKLYEKLGGDELDEQSEDTTLGTNREEIDEVS